MLDDPRPRLGLLAIRPLPDRTGLIIAGEADLTVKDMLRAAEADATRPGERRFPEGTPDHRHQPWTHGQQPAGQSASPAE